MLGEVDLVTALGRAGVWSAVAAQPGNPARYSRYAAERIEWVDPEYEPDELVGRLLNFAGSRDAAPVLYYDGDWDLLLVSRYREQLGKAFRFVVADPQLVEDLVDKARFQALAHRLELPVPPAVRLSPAGGDEPAVDLRYPLVAKPLTRQHQTWRPLSDAKAMHVADPAALGRVWEQLALASVDLLVQEVIPGPESRIESYHVYVDDSGERAGEFTGRKLRTHPRSYGYSTALEITDTGDVRNLGRELVARLGLTGVAKLDFKRDGGGRLHLLEVNPRFNLWHLPGAVAGVDLPALVYADLVELPRPKGAAVRAGVCWCSLAHDRSAARDAGISFARWASWALRCETKSGLSLRDPLPLVGASLWRVRRMIQRRLSGTDAPSEEAANYRTGGT